MSDNDSVIVDALKNEDLFDIRITYGNRYRWLYWDDDSKLFVVREHKNHAAKNVRTVCETADLAVAMKALTE